MMLYIIVLLFLIFQTSVRGNTVLVTLYALDLDANSFYIGIIVAATSLFPMLFAAYAGRLSDRLGYHFLFVIGTIGTGVALLLPFFYQNQLLVLLISQSLFGLFQIFTIVTVQNLIGALSTKETRSHHYSVFSLGVSVSNFLGPLLTGFSIDHFSYTKTYLLLGILSIIPGMIVFFRMVKLPKPIVVSQKANSTVKELLLARSLRKTYITSGIILTGVGMYEFYFPIYANSIDLSASIIGVILSCNAIAYILSRLLMQPLMNKFKEETILGACLFISALAFLFIPLFDDPILLMITSFVMGLGLGCCQPLSIVMAYNASPEGRTGEVLGIRLTINKSVQFLVPIVLSPLGSILGFSPVFWSNSLLFLYSGYSLLGKSIYFSKINLFNK
ncbi:MFS transporter [Peribacillus frigoritolerans]|uniref:MFS transporter n=1 Tax=Peribacillus frigoritolerans TaxID=450367 RepID=UPI0021D0B34D|nr:MFS transporter [Peribacillus frigoritolerans]MCU6602207.1 MFS transporter [Peribacillus frigoritolerans]